MALISSRLLSLTLKTIDCLLIILVLSTSVRAPLPNRVERASNPTLASFFRRVSSLLRALERFEEQHDLTHPQQLSASALDTLEEMWGSLQVIQTHLTRIESELPAELHQPVETSIRNILGYLRRIHEAVQSARSLTGPGSSGGCCQRVSKGGRGATSYDIQREQLETLLNMRMSLTEIARTGILGTTCRQTVYNHCKRLNVQLPSDRYSDVSDEHLRRVVQDVHHQQQNSGSEEVRATLAATRGLVVQRHRVRRALSVADPLGCASRWAHTTQRRTYSVGSPNSLWHLDNNHALRRWGFYIHGGIDGFSRLIPFLCVTIANSAKLALVCFIKGIRCRGLPSRIRFDRGSEYNDCESFMTWRRGSDRGSAIRGKSVHNQRIERLWRDVFAKVLEHFYKLFFHMEDTECLNVEDAVHRFALHYTFLPRIQAALTNWMHVHNNHGIRTEHHRTPEQLWFTNLIKQRCLLQASSSAPSRAVRDVSSFNIDDHTTDIMNRFDIHMADTHSEVVGRWLLTCPPLTEQDLVELRQGINPLRPSNVQGLDIYGEVVTFVLDCLERQQTADESQES